MSPRCKYHPNNNKIQCTRANNDNKRTLIPSLAADTSHIRSSYGSGHTSSGTIAGAVVGSVAGVALLVGAALIARKRYKRNMQMRQQQNELDNEDFYADPYQQNGEWNNRFFTNPAAATAANGGGGGYQDYPEAEDISIAAGARRSALPPTPRHQNTAGPVPQQQQLQSMSDEYDEYGHPRRESFWSSVSDRFRSLRR